MICSLDSDIEISRMPASFLWCAGAASPLSQLYNCKPEQGPLLSVMASVLHSVKREFLIKITKNEKKFTVRV